MKGTSIAVLLASYRSLQANAICERFWGGRRRECLDFFILLGERHLYRVVKEYVAYFNDARPHQGLGQRIPGGAGGDHCLPSAGWPASRLPVGVI